MRCNSEYSADQRTVLLIRLPEKQAHALFECKRLSENHQPRFLPVMGKTSLGKI